MNKLTVSYTSPYGTKKYTYYDNGLCVSSMETHDYGEDEKREYEFGLEEKDSIAKRTTYETSGNRKAVEILIRLIEYNKQTNT